MPYFEKIARAGITEAHYKYHDRSRPEPGIKRKRGKREKPTPEAQKKNNIRRAAQALTLILNENFDPTCWYITYNYRKDARPKNREELTEHARKLLRELRKRYKKAGKCLKYVWVPEVGPRGGSHIHIVISSIDLNLISDVWVHGGMYIEPLRSDRNYRKLAEYFVEYSEKTRRELGGKQIRYNPSRNLVRVPMEERKKRKKTFSADQIEVPEGWYLDKESVREWVNEFGYKYLYYLLVRTKPWKVKDG
ncbi:rolling circle replication-associated protein [[Clostridium] symbiosum]|uniref:rolling circle replication-associated protein n=1 Tax=Clostridium symbiosum TaxID=1512 RepID=UPI0034A3D21C